MYIFTFIRLLTVFDLVGLPTLILFHNGIPSLQFIDPNFSLYELTKFVIKYTGMHDTIIIIITYLCA